MSDIETVGMREFRANLQKYTKHKTSPIAITSHGEAVGYYIPVRPSPQESDLKALQKAVKKLSAVLQEKCVGEDEIVAEFRTAHEPKAEL